MTKLSEHIKKNGLMASTNADDAKFKYAFIMPRDGSNYLIVEAKGKLYRINNGDTIQLRSDFMPKSLLYGSYNKKYPTWENNANRSLSHLYIHPEMHKYLGKVVKVLKFRFLESHYIYSMPIMDIDAHLDKYNKQWSFPIQMINLTYVTSNFKPL